MKKAFFGIAILMLGLGAGSAKAQTVAEGVRALGVAETVAIQAQINVLKAKVAELQARIEAKRALEVAAVLVAEVRFKLADPAITPEKKAAIGASLAGISQSLLAVSETMNSKIAAPTIAFVPISFETSMGPVAVGAEKPAVVAESGASVAVKESEEAIAAVEVAAMKEGTDKTVEAILASEGKGKETAAISGKFESWHGIVVIALVVGILAFMLRRRREEREMRVLQS